MRRLIRVIVVSALLLTSLTVSARAASATAPDGFFDVSSTCTGGSGYPVKAGATLAVSTTTPYSGQTIEVSGANFQANEKVTLRLNGKAVATVKADDKGSFTTSLKVTSPAGKFELTATGAVCGFAGLFLSIRTAAGVLPITATQSPGGAGAGGAATGQGGGGLAFTGVDIALLLAVALVLIGGGGYLAHAGRRRHARRT